MIYLRIIILRIPDLSLLTNNTKADIIMQNITVKRNAKPIYDIIFTSEYSCFDELIKKLNLSGRKVCIVSDSNVAIHFLDELKSLFEKCDISACITHVFNAGEENKNTDTVFAIIEDLIKNHFDRNDVLVALGGGVTGDMTGFAASIYLRGIKFIQVPTSLLAMVDSSIGGKTGVDFKGYKNMVGAFHMPSTVLINTGNLSTLPKREYISGFAEIIKHAIIADNYYFKYLMDNYNKAVNLDTDCIKEIIYWSCRIKQSVVEKDPTEKGIRAHLNFGHTLGHAIEKYMDFKLLHGECISLGLVCAAYISMKRNMIAAYEYTMIIDLLKKYTLPVSFADIRQYSDKVIDYDEIAAITKSDKKSDGKRVKFVLIDSIGNAVIDTSVTESEMKEALRALGE